MKKHFLNLLLLLASAWYLTAADGFQAALEPAAVMEGEPFVLQLSNHGSEMPQLVKLPEKFVYQGSSQSTRIINGDRTVSVGYRFIAPAPGEYEIAPLQVKLGKKTVSTPPLKLKVVKDSTVAVGIEDVFVKGYFADKRSVFYVGEDIPLSVNLYSPQSLQIQLTAYPVLDIGKSVFRDFRRNNPENPSFARPQQRREVLEGKLYNSILFPSAFRPLAPGKLRVKGSLDFNIMIPEKQRRSDYFDDFFGSGISYRRIGRKLSFELPEITVKPLPEVPQDGFFLGLTGDFTGQISLSETKPSALEPLSMDLTLNAVGSSSFETLQVPQITLPDCRVYPGEVRKDGNVCVISYALVPLKAGTISIEKKFYYFDPLSGSYKAIVVDKALDVKTAAGKSSLSQSSAVLPPVAASAKTAEGIADEELPRTVLLYCKKAPESVFYRFYRSNRVMLAVLLFIAGPAVWLLDALIKKLRGSKSDHAEIRREKAKEMRTDLFEKVYNAPVEDLPLLATGKIAGYLCDRWKLPAGSTLEDVANAADDNDLAEALHECANTSYLPKELAKNALSDPERIRRILLNSLKASIIFIAVMPIIAVAAVPENWHEALKAYDKGRYKDAKDYFEKYANENVSDANVLYNLGCIAEANGEQEMALWYLESAGLMAPLDSATYENRNVMRRKFFLEPNDSTNSPQEALKTLRDRIHPEDYLVFAAFCWLAFFILLVFRKKFTDSAVWGCAACLLAFSLMALAVMLLQYDSTYSGKRALVIVKNAELYTFPGKHNGKKSGTLAGGTPVEIIDSESDYSLVKSGKLEGWTPNKNIRKLLTR